MWGKSSWNTDVPGDENPRKLELGRRAGGDGKQRLQLKETPQVILTHGYVRVPWGDGIWWWHMLEPSACKASPLCMVPGPWRWVNLRAGARLQPPCPGPSLCYTPSPIQPKHITCILLKWCKESSTGRKWSVRNRLHVKPFPSRCLPPLPASPFYPQNPDSVCKVCRGALIQSLGII